MIKLSPSLLAADPLHLGDALKLTIDAGCEELHFDVMDAHFVHLPLVLIFWLP